MKEESFIQNVKDKIYERQLNTEHIFNDNKFMTQMFLIFNKFIECFENGNKLIFCGNGGSAVDCQHIVAEFVVKLTKLRRSLPAASLTCNSSVITAISNDLGYEYVFTRQLEGIAKPKDVLVGISTSGNSANVVNAFEYAKKNNMYTISVTGDIESKLIELADESIIIPSKNTQIIQEAYLMVFHILCEKLDEVYE